jgi:hypothetical protein
LRCCPAASGAPGGRGSAAARRKTERAGAAVRRGGAAASGAPGAAARQQTERAGRRAGRARQRGGRRSELARWCGAAARQRAARASAWRPYQNLAPVPSFSSAVVPQPSCVFVRARPESGHTAVSRPESRASDMPDRASDSFGRSGDGAGPARWYTLSMPTNHMFWARTLDTHARAGVFRCTSIAFEVPDPANKAWLSAED